MGTSGNRDCQWASRRVLKDFTEDALTTSAGSLFQSRIARMVKANWRRRVQHLCWWNLHVKHKGRWPFTEHDKAIDSSTGVELYMTLSIS